MAFIGNKNFHPLERLLPPIGKVASTHWKQGFQTMETRRADYGQFTAYGWLSRDCLRLSSMFKKHYGM